MNELLCNLLDKKALEEFSPRETGEREVRFSVADYEVILFNFDIPTRGAWSADAAITKDGIDIEHDVAWPQKALWRRQLILNIGAQIGEEAAGELDRFFQIVAHSYNKSNKALADATLPHHDGEESLDLETWPLTEQMEIVPDFAVEGGYTILFGDPGSGKSILAHNIGLRSAAGIHHVLPERRREPITVYYLSLEMGYSQFRPRHNKLLASFPQVAQENFYFSCPDSFDFTNPRDRSMLKNTLAKLGAKLLIVDGHSYWIGNKDENDNGQMSDYIVVPITKMAKELELGTILIHHSPWEKQRIRGATVLWVGAEIGIHLQRDETRENYCTVSFKKWRPAFKRMPRPISYYYNPNTYVMGKAGEADFIEQLSLPSKRASVVKQIAAISGVQVRQARNKLNTLLQQNYLYEDEKGVIHNPDNNIGRI